MYAVGVDVSNGWSTVAVLRSKTDIVIRPFNVTHNSQGFADLLEKLSALDGEVKVVMEHTGNYYESIANVLHEHGLWVSAVNPLLLKEYGGNSLRGVKTDKEDSKKIARYALDNWEELRQLNFPKDECAMPLSFGKFTHGYNTLPTENTEPPVPTGQQEPHSLLQ